MSHSAIDDLHTLRDMLRHAISRFNAAGLTYGHGTTQALDEAAFILLESLHLPIDELEPWLEARLTREERSKVLNLIEARIMTRKPAPYLVNKAYIQGVPFYVDERVIVPRSFIGELLFHGLAGEEAGALIAEPDEIATVLDLCTGSGCLAILAAQIFENAIIDAVDLSPGAIEVAARNVKMHHLEDRITLLQGDLFSPLKKRHFDLIIANPPYVSAKVVRAFPPEHKAEPQMAHLGGEDGFDLVRRIIIGAKEHLTANGALICEIGTDREILEAEFPDLPFLWLDTEESEGEVFFIQAKDLP